MLNAASDGHAAAPGPACEVALYIGAIMHPHTSRGYYLTLQTILRGALEGAENMATSLVGVQP